MKLRLAVTAGTFLLAGVANAATSYPTREGPRPMSSSYVDFTSCALPEAAARAQLEASLRVTDADRGMIAASSPCAVDPMQPFPSKVDDRYRR